MEGAAEGPQNVNIHPEASARSLGVKKETNFPATVEVAVGQQVNQDMCSGPELPLSHGGPKVKNAWPATRTAPIRAFIGCPGWILLQLPPPLGDSSPRPGGYAKVELPP